MKTRICIGIPTAYTMKSKMVFALTRMIKGLSVDYDVLVHDSPYIHYNRERLVQRAIDGGYSHIFFIDNDLYFEKDSLERLLSHDKDIIGADYNYKKLPIEGILKTENLEGEIIDEMVGDLRKCAGLGTGFLLIKLSVFEKLDHPWFFFEADGHGGLRQGEDMWFCNKARKAGFDIWCDTKIKLFHLGEYFF